MKKIGVFFLGMLVVMAVLVNMGWIKEQGLFGVTDSVYSSITPVVKKVTDTITDIFAEDTIEFEDGEMVVVNRIRFKDSAGVSYYCDILGKVDFSAEDSSHWNTLGQQLDPMGEWEICDTNYSGELSIKTNFFMIRIVDESLKFPNNVFWWKTGPLATGKCETKVMLYSEYVENYKGKDVFLA